MTTRILSLAAVGVLALAALSCDDDTTPVKPINDTGQNQQDTGSPWPDLQTQPDQYVWPDTGQTDQTIWPDSYSQTPFGCKADSDCFGKKCCPTPWGVKLCAASCS